MSHLALASLAPDGLPLCSVMFVGMFLGIVRHALPTHSTFQPTDLLF